jgi:hypothetical protein
MRKAFKNAEFHPEYKKITDEGLNTLMPEKMKNAIRQMRRRPK